MAARRWRTKDGKTIPVTDMTVQHIRNTLAILNRYLEKVEDEETIVWGYRPQGDMASYYHEQACDEASDVANEARRFHDYWSRVFKKELKSRGEPV